MVNKTSEDIHNFGQPIISQFTKTLQKGLQIESQLGTTLQPLRENSAGFKVYCYVHIHESILTEHASMTAQVLKTSARFQGRIIARKLKELHKAVGLQGYDSL